MLQILQKVYQKIQEKYKKGLTMINIYVKVKYKQRRKTKWQD